MKTLIGAPTTGPVLGHEDVSLVLAEHKQQQRTTAAWSEKDFLALDPAHPLSCMFYAHLFRCESLCVVAVSCHVLMTWLWW